MKTAIILLRKEKNGGAKTLITFDYLVPLVATGSYGECYIKYAGAEYPVAYSTWNCDTHTLEIYVED